MTKGEKLQTEVITTEQAIYCMNHQYNYEKYECDYCPYCLLCEEKGIEGKMIKMAIKALEENEGLKEYLDKANCTNSQLIQHIEKHNMNKACKDCAIKKLDKSESEEVGAEKYFCPVVGNYVDETPDFYCANFEKRGSEE